MNNYKEEYDRWLKSPLTTEEEKLALKEMSDDEIYEAFYKNAEFGTAGMRGVMGLGTNRLNIHTIRMAAKGMAEYINSVTAKAQASVAIAYDTRNNSPEFALETAKVLAASGIKAYLFDRYSPVPLLSFAVRELECDGGVVITASHNTSEYNGFKVYDNTGCQMGTKPAGRISENIADLDDPLGIKTSSEDDPLIVKIGDELINSFMDAIKDCGHSSADGYDEKAAASDLKVVYTSIHGSGRDYVMTALANAGFDKVTLTESQAEFNGDFPTVAKPNPEDSAALRYAAEIALSNDADIIIGTDPDCDRIGAGIISDGNITYLSGNQMGALLIDYLNAKGKSTMVTTIVTSGLGPQIAADKGLDVRLTLTGFKYIGGIMNEMEEADCEDEFFMGYEESYGYLTGTHARDKDGISSALAICRMAAYWKSKGKTLIDILNDIYARYGFWYDTQESFVYEGSKGEQTMKEIMAELREKGSSLLENMDIDMAADQAAATDKKRPNDKDASDSASAEKTTPVTFTDFSKGIGDLPPANVLKYGFEDNSWVAVRPSGTEPKIKVYYCIRGIDKPAAERKQQEAAERVGRITRR